jgi:RsiW-degrading membrane proteinase PrsW (M82 family)
MYTVFFISFVISSVCLGYYLHPSSAAQLQRTAIDCVWFWFVIPLEQVLVWDTLTLKHHQLQTVTDCYKLKLSMYIQEPLVVGRRGCVQREI